MSKQVTLLSRAFALLFILCYGVRSQAQVAGRTSTGAALQKPGETVKLVFEKAFLHTDRDTYLQGDTLWFKAYLLNAQDNKPANSSHTLYVDLINPENKVIDAEIVRMDGGAGRGDMMLPDSVGTGIYRLRAYTSWMRNFGDNFIFEKQITLLNTVHIASSAATKSAKKTPVESSATSVNTSAASRVMFYPEGGSLVEGINAIVAVKAMDQNGNGMKAAGAVIAARGDTVARFVTDTLGMGLFTMLPVPGQTYSAQVKTDNRSIKADVPQALKSGITLQLKQVDTLIHVVISHSGIKGTDGQQPQVLLIAKHAGKIILNQALTLSGQQVKASIPVTGLPEGIASITLYDQQGRPNCERLIYVHHPYTKFNITLTGNKAAYHPGELVSLNLKAAPKSTFSVAAVADGLLDGNMDNISSYLLLSSELKGKIAHAARYFDTTNVNRYNQLDLLLLTQGWRDFVWRRLADSALHISHPAESSITVAGVLKDEARNKVMPQMNVTLFASAAKGTKLFTAITDSAGRFQVPGLTVYGKTPVKLSAVNQKGAMKGRFYLDTAGALPVKPRQTLLAVDTLSQVLHMLTQNRIKSLKGITQLKEVTVSGKKQSVQLPDGRILATFGRVKSFDITPKDFDKNLGWFLMTYTGAQASRDPARNDVNYVVDGHLMAPIVKLVDGTLTRVPRRDERQFLYSLPMDKVKHVELRQVVDQMGKSHNLLTVSIIENGLQDNPGDINTLVDGYYQARVFYNPSGSAEAARSYHPTVFWNPDIKTDASGNAIVRFYNTTGTKIRVVIQGISPDGTPLNSMVDYAIK